MHIAHLSAWRVPVERYGGSSRVVYWQAKAQAALGHRVTLLAPPGSTCPGAEVIEVPAGAVPGRYIPSTVEVAHLHGVGPGEVRVPHLITSQGNSPMELANQPNKVYVSRDHARRGGSQAFVYNGVDPEEFIYQERKADYLLFLSKVSRRVKGVDVALRLARRLGFRLVVAGGTRWGLRKTGGLWDSVRADVRFCGEVGGRRKAELLAGARALLFPIRWDEPFGIVVAEAMVSGTPVITTPRGSMPELVTPDVGFLCRDEREMEDAIRHVGDLAPAACRRRALAHFTSTVCAQKYVHYYRRLLANQPLEDAQPAARATGAVESRSL
jgi:glycosyltransferase involved in cell wall biosynthesis